MNARWLRRIQIHSLWLGPVALAVSGCSVADQLSTFAKEFARHALAAYLF